MEQSHCDRYLRRRRGEEIDVDALLTFITPQMPEAPLRHEFIEDQDLGTHMDGCYEPIQIGEKYWIVPEWMTPPEADAVSIKLDPGLAFGTGNHASTFLCLQWLGQTDVKDKNCHRLRLWFRYFRRSRIHYSGCKKNVYATDIDPQAVLATKQNAELNGVLRSSVCRPTRRVQF